MARSAPLHRAKAFGGDGTGARGQRMALEQRSPAANAESEVILLYRRPSTNENLLQARERLQARSGL